MPRIETIQLPKIFELKFIRLESSIWISSTRSPLLRHSELAGTEKIEDKVRRMRRLQPSQVDGGIFRSLGYEIIVGGDASTLLIPVSKEARDITIRRFQDLYGINFVLRSSDSEYYHSM
jgi:hypothetical protein